MSKIYILKNATKSVPPGSILGPSQFGNHWSRLYLVKQTVQYIGNINIF